MGGKFLLCSAVFQGEFERGRFDFRQSPLELPLLDWGVQGVIDLLNGIDEKRYCASQECGSSIA